MTVCSVVTKKSAENTDVNARFSPNFPPTSKIRSVRRIWCSCSPERSRIKWSAWRRNRRKRKKTGQKQRFLSGFQSLPHTFDYAFFFVFLPLEGLLSSFSKARTSSRYLFKCSRIGTSGRRANRNLCFFFCSSAVRRMVFLSSS